MAGVKHRGRMGVEDGRHGEQDRAGASRGGSESDNRGHWGRKPTEGVDTRIENADSKVGGEVEREGSGGYTADSRGRYASQPESPPNTVDMSITGRGRSAPAGYGNTGERLNTRGSLGNTRQQAYNDHQGHEGGSGNVLGREDSNFYNDLGNDRGEPRSGHGRARGAEGGEGDSGSGVDTYTRGKHIEGFGGGKSTFQSYSQDYNDLGAETQGALVGHEDQEGDSGSGTINSALGGGKAKEVKGFSRDPGLKSGMI